MRETFGSGSNIVEGVNKYVDTLNKSGVLKDNEKKNENNENNNVEETKTNLFKKAFENKKKEENNEDKDSKLISYSVEGLNPKNIFNYNPQGNIGFDLGDKNEGFFATGDVDASRRGIDTNFETGFKNENVNVGYKPESGLTYDFKKQFGDNTNLGINQSGFKFDTKLGENTNVNVNQSGAQFGTKLGEDTNVNLGYGNGNFNPSLTTKFKDTNIAVNPDRFNLNRTFEIGDDTRINVGGEVDFDGDSKGKIDFTKDFLNKKVQLYGGADTKGDFEVGTKFKFLNL